MVDTLLVALPYAAPTSTPPCRSGDTPNALVLVMLVREMATKGTGCGAG
jgi:hypothetical protein